MRYARARFWTALILTGAVWLAALFLGGAGSELDETYRGALYAGNDKVLARNAVLLTYLGSGWILAPLAIIFGIIGMNKAGLPKGGAIAGLVTGGIALLICLLWVVAFGAAVGNAAAEAERMNQQIYSNEL